MTTFLFTGCVNITYLPNEYGMSLTFTLDGKVLYKETISGQLNYYIKLYLDTYFFFKLFH